MTWRSENVAVGVPKGRQRKVVCLFDPEVFEELQLIAKREGTSLAEQIRILVELGLEVDAR